jgi:hypothetical protein
LNEHTEQELTKKLNNILESLIGNELSEIDPLLIRNTVNQRFIHIEDKAYEVTFIYMILREETIIHLEATEK